MSDWYQDIVDFMRTGEQDTPKAPTLMDRATWRLRKRLIQEEAGEALDAINEYVASDGENGTTAEVAKELTDIIVVTIGTAVAMGVDLRPIWDATHQSNMAKFPGGKVIKNEHGKILKPKGWQKPDIAALIAAQKA